MKLKLYLVGSSTSISDATALRELVFLKEQGASSLTLLPLRFPQTLLFSALESVILG